MELQLIEIEWNEEDHPRDKDGEFASKGGEGASKTKKSKKTKPVSQEPQQIAGPDEEIDHVVNVAGHDINIPVGKEQYEYDVVDEFMTKNNLYEKIKEKDIPDTGYHPLADRLTLSLENNIGIVDEPIGSCYLTSDGNWVGGEGIYGYDEDHRPQMRKALSYAGIKIEEDSDSSIMLSGMKIAGAVRVGARGDLNLDIVKPLTSYQVRSISDYAIAKGLGPENIIIDTNNIEGLDEKRILQQLGIEDPESFDDDENETVQNGEFTYKEIKEALLAGDIQNLINRYTDLKRAGIDDNEINRVIIAEFGTNIPYPNFINDWQPPSDIGQGFVPPIGLEIPDTGFPPTIDDGYAGGRDVANLPSYKLDEPFYPKPPTQPYHSSDQNWVATGSKVDSQPPTIGVIGHNVTKSVPEWRYDIEDNQMKELVVDRNKKTGQFVKDGTTKLDLMTDKSLPQAIEKARGEYLHGTPKHDHQTVVEMPHMIIDEVDEGDLDDDDDEPPYMTVMSEIEPRWAKYHYGGPHLQDDICNKFQMKVFDLNDMVHRPIPPSEGLGYTTTHPNCPCYWEMIAKPSKTSVPSPTAQRHLTNVKKMVTRRANTGELHTVHPDGTLSQRTRKTNPMYREIREAILEIRHEFEWMTDEYLGKIKQINAPGRMYLIRASGEAITDHRGEGEPYRRWLSPDELHAMARTAITKKMDINHKSAPENNYLFNTKSQVLDSEFSKARNEIQMLINEQDPEIINAIDNQVITAVSINGGSPRTEAVVCPDCPTNNCECFLVPEGVVLGETDDIALTWVVTDPRGMMWRGMWIPPAIPGVKTTAIQPI